MLRQFHDARLLDSLSSDGLMATAYAEDPSSGHGIVLVVLGKDRHTPRQWGAYGVLHVRWHEDPFSGRETPALFSGRYFDTLSAATGAFAGIVDSGYMEAYSPPPPPPAMLPADGPCPLCGYHESASGLRAADAAHENLCCGQRGECAWASDGDDEPCDVHLGMLG